MIDWSLAPQFAKWGIIDDEGNTVYTEEEPTLHTSEDSEEFKVVYWEYEGKNLMISPAKNWKESKQKRPVSVEPTGTTSLEESNQLKLYQVDFTPICPVPYGLIILANTDDQALQIAKETIKHTEPKLVKQLPIEESGVVLYLSGDY